jgi:glycosyltransferase involved in cell wall biosynthesis
MRTLAGLVCCRNVISLDYCFEEAIKSLLGVCDEVLVCDCDSEDTTRYFIDEWSKREPKLTIANYPWPNPIADTQFYPVWINYARQHAKSQMILHLDADEIVHEDDYELIRKAADAGSTLFLKRYNFWRDAQHLIPEGHCCGTKVLRIAPANMPIPSDYPWEPAAATMKQAIDSQIRVYHYGFLRRRDAFFKKARVVQQIWAGSFDPRLEAAEAAGGNWMEHEGVVPWKDDLVSFTGTHPEAAKQWLKDRNYAC